jgi:hypothetical protein
MEDEKYKALKAQLDLTPWPEVYMFKFIVPNDLHKVSQLEGMFNHDTSKISTRESKKGNYVSFTDSRNCLGSSIDGAFVRVRRCRSFGARLSCAVVYYERTAKPK